MAEASTMKYTFYSEVPIQGDVTRLLSQHETPIFAVKTIRDMAIFTSKRILIADKQGLIGKKVEYCSIPYKSIVTFSIETAGTFDLDAEIMLTLSGGVKVELEFMKGKNMTELLFKVHDTIAEYVLR